ncbi:MAG: ExbD/TolR family protein [Planctomycetota bacterium]
MIDSAAPPPHAAEFEEEAPAQLKRAKLEESEMDIAPMIDCTFLLLIFFIVCSHVGQQAQVDLPKAKFGVPVPSKLAVVLTVAAGDGDAIRVFKGDGIDDATLINVGTVAEQEDAVAAYVAEHVNEGGDKQHVLIKAARGLKHRDVSRIAKASVRNAEVSQLFIAIMEAH